jgi:phosphoribosyl-ATP pyrophosphohydrolase/phosphoribosyl-AMP cyclohydrolase
MASSSSTVWPRLRPDSQGLVPAIVQHADTGQVLMLGWMNEDALAATFQRQRVTFWSRSRNALWEKGETSGNTLHLVDVRHDCDADALLVRARPVGPVCHTGTTSCFHAPVDGDDAIARDDGPPIGSGPVLDRVWHVIGERKAGRGATQREGKSYVRSLLDAGASTIGAKIEEEAGELARAIASEDDARVAAEAADLVFHALVGLAHRDIDFAAVAEVFAQRVGESGLDEKARRARG